MLLRKMYHIKKGIGSNVASLDTLPPKDLKVEGSYTMEAPTYVSI
jgi:hypothetical protein